MIIFITGMVLGHAAVAYALNMYDRRISLGLLLVSCFALGVLIV